MSVELSNLNKYTMSLKTATEVDPIKSERTGNVREVGSQAIWSLSSCKPGQFYL